MLAPRKHQRGYTLAEVILVLTAFSILTIIFVPLQSKAIQHIETKQYIAQFKEDVLLAQQLTMTDHPSYWLMIRPAQKDYYLYDYQQKKTIFHREFPPYWKLNLQSLTTPVRFNSQGTLRNPGTMRISSPHTAYKITFPFGKSRVTINEQ
ncbi:competence type IV pilus minor pilin ComGD [Halobacillus sp. A5]|uniref:competence type IV pilus minor pilin ComGD n=1 Tax=Halobacillus sp. A5 TaxID=2880263 RepID=UPI0020A66E35|nr:competence type IV pilus minor pilin ComGD [Halobacillus sp. A5]MCP3025697.1 prepilin-type N-terminal cleavage/methylation domain-containing protein [Halobacillus sp. A5]